jgi:hypothetical protein
MPGLFGALKLDGGPLDPAATHALLDEMADRLRHLRRERVDRWDAYGQGLAVRRVGLDHLQPLPWPQPGEGKATTTWLDGVLATDSATPASLAKRGADAFGVCRALEGFWSALVDDGRRRMLAVDRRSSRPIFWTQVAGTLYFAPELKALLAVPGVERAVDPGALGMFFASGFVLADMTFFAAIKRLEGGTALVVEEGRLRLEKYADYRFTVEGDGTPYEEIRRELGATLRSAVERHYADDPERSVIFLSGGKDSRAIVASAARAVDPARIRAVSWTANAPQPGSDVYVARQVAEALGVDLRVVQRDQSDFRSKAWRLGYILDSQTDVGAFHGEELRLMEELADAGAVRVLRGDQCFTRGRAMLSPDYAILRMCLRSTAGLADGRDFWRSAAYPAVGEGGDQVIAKVQAEYRDVQQDNAGDQVYFRHRLQGYLNQAAYFKSLVLDHRNPLLDESLLRLIQRLSIAARREQRVLNEALAETFPELSRFPYAERSNLEDYVALLAAEGGPVRQAVRAELEDEDSAAWEWLDREALLGLLNRLGRQGGSEHWRVRLKKKIKNTVRDAVYGLPTLDTRLRGIYLRRETRADEVLLRALAIKQFFDLFVQGDGSRRVYEAKLAGMAN